MDIADPLIVADAREWREWLDENEGTSDGVWLMLAKKGTTKPTSLSYDQALDEALCSGWIDGQKRSFDAATFIERFTPRRQRSTWSERNVGHVARLTAEGRMTARGISEVERAQADGRWDAAYKGPATIEVPDDLAAALAASPRASAAFAELNSQNRYAVLFRTVTTRTPATRARTIAKFITMLEDGGTPHPSPRNEV